MDDPLGRRLVAAQAALFVVIAAGPWFPIGAGLATPPSATLLGAALMLAGSALAVLAGLRLGPNLTPFPRPRPGGELVTRGVYRYARHPIYGGVLLVAGGWAIAQSSLGTGAAVLLLLWLFEHKSRYEERLLIRTFPAYADYTASTRRFLPFVY
jgi:protein-S-isoprenylcysteine O-methyltransferase Ste14